MIHQLLYKETKNLSILFVEDYDELRENSLEILDNYFDYCEGAVDGKQGLVQYQRYHDNNHKYFDLVITDIKMPEMDGITLTNEIYKCNENQAIIVLSAHQESEYLLTLINLGIEQFITKPIDQENMLTILYKVSKKINNKHLEENHGHKIVLSVDAYIDRNNLAFYYQDELLKLTKNELLFIKLISDNFEKICSNDQIVNFFEYDGVVISNDNIRSLVTKLRKKLPINCIESIYGVGYRLFAPLDKTI